MTDNLFVQIAKRQRACYVPSLALLQRVILKLLNVLFYFVLCFVQQMKFSQYDTINSIALNNV